MRAYSVAHRSYSFTGCSRLFIRGDMVINCHSVWFAGFNNAFDCGCHCRLCCRWYWIEAVKWAKVGSIAASWVVSPVIAGGIAYFLFRSVQKLILNTSNPIENAKRYVPIYIFLTGTMISLVTMLKGLKHIGLDLSKNECYSISLFVGIFCALVGTFLIRKIKFTEDKNIASRLVNVENVFGVLMIFSACAMAFAHGSNDVANAVGPVAAIVSIVSSDAVKLHKNL